jgi:hypothetical protein
MTLRDVWDKFLKDYKYSSFDKIIYFKRGYVHSRFEIKLRKQDNLYNKVVDTFQNNLNSIVIFNLPESSTDLILDKFHKNGYVTLEEMKNIFVDNLLLPNFSKTGINNSEFVTTNQIPKYNSLNLYIK